MMLTRSKAYIQSVDENIKDEVKEVGGRNPVLIINQYVGVHIELCIDRRLKLCIENRKRAGANSNLTQ